MDQELVKYYSERLGQIITEYQLKTASGWICFILFVLATKVKEFRAVKEGFLYCWMHVKTAWLWIVKKAMWRKQFTNILIQNKVQLDRIAQDLAKVTLDMEKVKHELEYNSGSTTKDAVRDTRNELKRVVNVLIENQELRKAQELTSDRMIFKVDPLGACTFISDTFLRAFSCSSGDILQFGFQNYIHPEDREETRLKWEKAIKTQTAFKDEQRIRNCATEDYIRASVIAHPVQVEGTLLYFYGTIEVI